MTLKKSNLEFDDPQFMADFAFLTDISSHLATLNLRQLVNALFSQFQDELKLFVQQLGNKYLSYFPAVAEMNCA